MDSIKIEYNVVSHTRGLSVREESCLFQMIRTYRKDISDIKYRKRKNGNTEIFYFTITFRDSEDKLRYEKQIGFERFLTSKFYKWNIVNE